MPYEATVTIEKEGLRGRKVTVVETGAGPGDYVELIDTVGTTRVGPGRVLRCINTRSAGSGATRQPLITTSSGAAASSGAARYCSTSATAVATKIDEQLSVPITCENVIYHTSQSDTGNDNAFTTIYHFILDWA